MIEWAVRVFLGYWAIGMLFAPAFAMFGVERVDAAAEKSGRGFRLLVMPGAAALWPVLAVKWARAAR